jgi:hypothetical protein
MVAAGFSLRKKILFEDYGYRIKINPWHFISSECNLPGLKVMVSFFSG